MVYGLVQDHPNIVKLWEVIDDEKDEKLYLVMDYMKKGAVMSPQYWREENKGAEGIQSLDCRSMRSIESSRFNPKNHRKPLSEQKCLKYFRDLILGLDYLHSHCGVIHRDIKPQNMMITEDDRLKIADFGVSQICEEFEEVSHNMHGTKSYMAPELWKSSSNHLMFFFMVIGFRAKQLKARKEELRLTFGQLAARFFISRRGLLPFLRMTASL